MGSVVQGDDEVETVKIEAPSLQKFYYCYSIFEISPCKFNLVACQNLKVLSLTRVIVADQQFNDLISEFPLLEVLCLLNCDLLERIKIPNKCLKRLILHCYKLKKVEIDAPNLRSFQYKDNLMPSITSTSSSGQWEADLSLRPDDHLNSPWFHRMRYLLAKTKHFKALTLSIRCLETIFNVEELRGISVPSIHALEHLNLNLRSSSISYPDLLDGLLWSCQPETLFIEFKDLESRNKFLKVLHEKIEHKFDLNCCYLRRIKCWQHSLKDIESYDGYGKRLCWNTLSDNLPNLKDHQEKEMRITFKWRHYSRGIFVIGERMLNIQSGASSGTCFLLSKCKYEVLMYCLCVHTSCKAGTDFRMGEGSSFHIVPTRVIFGLFLSLKTKYRKEKPPFLVDPVCVDS